MPFLRRLYCVLLLFPILGLVGCVPPPPAYEGTVDSLDYAVARVDTFFEITVPQLYDSLYHSPIQSSGGVVSRERVKDFLDSMLCDTLAGLKALDVPLGDYYVYNRIYRMRMNAYLRNAFYDRMVYDVISADSQEVADFYFARQDLFTVPDQVLLYHILISPVGLKLGPDSNYYRSLSPEQFNIELEEYAFQVRRLIDMGMRFEDVAREYSDDQIKGRQGGLMGWTQKEIYRDPFDSIAFSMDDGEISQPYPDRDGWHIIMVADRVEAGLLPLGPVEFDVARKTLQTIRANDRSRALADSLHSKPIEIEYNEAYLDSNVYQLGKSLWAAVVNGADTIDFNTLRSFEETYRNNRRVSSSTAAMKKEMIAVVADELLVVQAARSIGLDTSPEGQRIDRSLRQEYGKTIVEQDRSDPSWLPSQEAVREYYEKHREDFTVRKPLKLQHIIVEDSTMALFIRDQALAGVDFLDLAAEYYPGDEEVRRELADLGWVGPDDVPEIIYRAGLSTEEGSVSKPIKGEYGYHLVKLISRETEIDFTRAQSTIVPLLKAEHNRRLFEEYRDGLYKQFRVSFPGRIPAIHLKPLDQRTGR